jgi:hypothetical protein
VTITAPSAAKKLPPLELGEFRFVTNALTADTTGGDNPRRRFKTVASSTITDLAGNTISITALEQLAADFRAGLPIFMDHDYTNVVDKVFGTSDSAEIVPTNAKDARTGATIYDLVVGGIVNEPNPRAVQLHDSIAGGYVKLGASIGAIVRKHKRDKETGGMLIDGITGKEASIVGIAKNQRSWAYVASLAAADVPEDSALAEDEEEEQSADQPAEEQVVASNGEVLQQWVVTNGTSGTAANSTITISSGTAPSPEPVVVSEGEPEVVAAAEPVESTTEPTIKASEDAPQEDTTPGGQEADAAIPETAPATEDDADPAIEQQAGVEVEDVAALVAHAKALVEEIGKLRSENERLTDELATVKAGYDRLSDVEKDATDAIRKVMQLPLRRQAVGHVEDFTARYPGLDPRVTAYIARSTKEKE